MTSRDKRRFDMLIRVRNSGAAYRQLFPETSDASAAFAVIATETQKLEALEVAERLASRAARAARKTEARRLLVEWLVRAKTTTRVLVKTIPQLAAHVDLPDPVDDRTLLTIARQFVTAVAPYAEQFAEKGIAIEALSGLIEPFETAINDRGSSRGEHAQARADIALSMAHALEAVETLDLTVPNHLADNAVTLEAWKRERRVVRSKPSRSTAAPAEPKAVPPAAAA